jgi:GGDEF domain-containing protein
MTQVPCERIWQRELAALQIPRDHTLIQVTLSCGMTKLPQHGSEIETFLSHTDDLHYLV